uniref:tRNA-intron lyase n=1 Tax=Peronospora matthiolae TaxID=2874970 RepID=A0AAV1UWF8_9STRA
MISWEMLPGGHEVEVAGDEDDVAVWRDMQSRGYGIPPVAFGPRGKGSTGDLWTGKPGTLENKRRRHLTLPEFYYLMAMDDVLPGGGVLLPDLWSRLASSSATFTRTFVIYQHFRRRGWIPRSGLNYGAHYVLYRGSAAAFHSEYIVYVQRDGEVSSWNSIQSHTRIAADAKKTVLLCTLTSERSPDDTATPKTVKSTVKPTLTASDEGLTSGTYSFFGIQYTIEAVAIRFWDASIAGGQQLYTFQLQPVLPKNIKSAKRKGNIQQLPKR